jgi:hypothetical protein
MFLRAVFWDVDVKSDTYWPTIALMMEAVISFETSVSIYQTTRRNIPEHCHLHTWICYLCLGLPSSLLPSSFAYKALQRPFDKTETNNRFLCLSQTLRGECSVAGSNRCARKWRQGILQRWCTASCSTLAKVKMTETLPKNSFIIAKCVWIIRVNVTVIAVTFSVKAGGGVSVAGRGTSVWQRWQHDSAPGDVIPLMNFENHSNVTVTLAVHSPQLAHIRSSGCPRMLCM